MFISNLLGIRAITLINYLALTVLFLLIGLIIVFNLDFLGSGLRIAEEALSVHGNVDPNILWNVTASLFWAFLGWENLSFSLGEMKTQKKRSLLILAELCSGRCHLYLTCSDKRRSQFCRSSP
jgi:amino acid transporter